MSTLARSGATIQRAQVMSLGAIAGGQARTSVPSMPVKHGRDMAADLPPAPPCFPDEESWRDYVAQAAHSQRREDGPRAFIHGRINPEFNYCADCPSAWAAQHQRTGNCQPGHLMAVLGYAQKLDKN